MNSTDIIIDLNTAKSVLCVPDMLTDEMRIKIGQVITNAINYIEEHEPHELTREEWEAWKKSSKRDPICKVWKDTKTPFWALYPEDIHEISFLTGDLKLFSGKPDESMIYWELPKN